MTAAAGSSVSDKDDDDDKCSSQFIIPERIDQILYCLIIRT